MSGFLKLTTKSGKACWSAGISSFPRGASKAFLVLLVAILCPSWEAAAEGLFAGYSTNRGAVYRLVANQATNIIKNLRFRGTNVPLPDPGRFPPEVYERVLKARLSQPEFLTNISSFTNEVFAHYLPESLSAAIWSRLIARTNGRSTLIWSRREHPLGWPRRAPVVEWHRKSLIWGMKGLTALSPCWDREGASGQVPVTLLTPRHGYARGHGMGREGIVTTFRGNRVWFVTLENKVVEAKVTVAAVHAQPGKDYSILMFNEDLPSSITPLRVASPDTVKQHCPAAFRGAPLLLFYTEQTGNVSVGLPGFEVPVYKGGDSGSPDLFPYLDELVFLGGRSTSQPSKEMQADIDALCARESVDPKRYQLRWADLSTWPEY